MRLCVLSIFQHQLTRAVSTTMPRRRPDDVSHVTDIRDVRMETSSTVRSVGYSDTVAPNGRTVLRQPVAIHTQPPPASRQRTDDGGDEPSFPDNDTLDLGTVHVAVRPKKARRNNFFVSTVRLLI